MIRTADEIYNELRRIDMQYTGNVVEVLDTYDVKGRKITLYIERNTSGNGYRYNIGISDTNMNVSAQAGVVFGYYPVKNVGHETFLGTPGERIIVRNPAMTKNLYEILKAIGKLYNLPVEHKHY